MCILPEDRSIMPNNIDLIDVYVPCLSTFEFVTMLV
jgi:hypothetical protein